MGVKFAAFRRFFTQNVALNLFIFYGAFGTREPRAAKLG